MYLCKALLNVCIYDKGAIKIRYNNNNNIKMEMLIYDTKKKYFVNSQNQI